MSPPSVSRAPSSPGVTGARARTAACTATSARGSAGSQTGSAGLCFVRARHGDQIVLTTWGRSSGFCVDPIEKKPLNHFLPGTPVLSFGTAGCNLTCAFCQNWDISKSREIDTLADRATPETHRPRGRGARLPQRRVHLQRPGDLPRVRDRRGPRLSRARHQDRRGHGRLREARGAARILRRDGRRQRRPEGLHRALLPEALQRPPGARARHAPLPPARDPASGSRSPRS